LKLKRLRIFFLDHRHLSFAKLTVLNVLATNTVASDTKDAFSETLTVHLDALGVATVAARASKLLALTVAPKEDLVGVALDVEFIGDSVCEKVQKVGIIELHLLVRLFSLGDVKAGIEVKIVALVFLFIGKTED